MRKALILTTLGLALGLAACGTYQGGTGNDTGTTYGTASDLRSPSGLDRAKGTNLFNTMPPMPENDTGLQSPAPGY